MYEESKEIFARSNCRGAALVEMAIVFPVLLLLTFLLIEMFSYYSTSGLAEAAAERALSMAQTSVSLMDEEIGDSGEPKYLERKKEIEAAATAYLHDLAGSTGGSGLETFSVRLVLPEAQPGESMSEALRREPIVALAEGNLKTFGTYAARYIGLADVPISGKSAGMFELPDSSAFPKLVDCAGNTLDTVSQLYISDASPENCPCNGMPNRVWNGSACVCRSGLVERNGECVCPIKGQTKTPSGSGYTCACPDCPSGAEKWNNNGVCDCRCEADKTANPDGTCVNCDAGLLNCEGDQYALLDPCECRCPDGALGTPCECPGDMIVAGSQCICENACGSNEEPFFNSDEGKCDCRCKDGYSDVDGQCVRCVEDNFECTGDQYFSSSACACLCPGIDSDADPCECPGEKVLQGTVCKCPACDDPNTVSDLSIDCNCLCDESKGFLPGTSPCECPGNEEVIGGECKCQPCTGTGETLDGTSACSCICDASKGFVDEGGSCGCEGDKVEVGGVCECPPCGTNAGSTWNAETQLCECSCNAGFIDPDSDGNCDECTVENLECTGDQYVGSNCSCVCPAGSVDAGDGSCECPDGMEPSADGKSCVCSEDEPCPVGSTRDPNTCGCNCDGALYQPGPADPVNGCECYPGLSPLGDGSYCGCSNSCPEGAAPFPGEIDGSRCQCVCGLDISFGPGGPTVSENEFVNGGGTPVPAGGSCACDNADKEPDGNGNCVCADDCPFGSTQNPSDCSCECDNPAKDFVDGACVCESFTGPADSVSIDGTSCNAPHVEDLSSCECVCGDVLECEILKVGSFWDVNTCSCVCPAEFGGGTDDRPPIDLGDGTLHCPTGECDGSSDCKILNRPGGPIFIPERGE